MSTLKYEKPKLNLFASTVPHSDGACTDGSSAIHDDQCSTGANIAFACNDGSGVGGVPCYTGTGANSLCAAGSTPGVGDANSTSCNDGTGPSTP